MSESPVCPLLKQHHIAHAGIFWARYPFEIVRSDQSGSYDGLFWGERKRVGRWGLEVIGRGSLSFAAFVQNAFRCREDAPGILLGTLPGVARAKTDRFPELASVAGL